MTFAKLFNSYCLTLQLPKVAITVVANNLKGRSGESDILRGFKSFTYFWGTGRPHPCAELCTCPEKT